MNKRNMTGCYAGALACDEGSSPMEHLLVVSLAATVLGLLWLALKA